MKPEVELFSATDPVHIPHRQVWYWTEFEGMKSERSNDWATVNARAVAICVEQNRCLVDRSDKGSGYLFATLS